MFVLVLYDVSTSDPGGPKRLRKVAKICERYGERVQKSSFECEIDASQYEVLKHELAQAMDQTKDNLRFYRLGKNYKKQVEHLGKFESLSDNDVLIF